MAEEPVMGREPEQIVDADHERIWDRVCAIDVGKQVGKVCTRVSRDSASGVPRRVSTVWEVPATTGAVIELGARLLGEGIEQVTVESTSDYWRIWFYLLEAAGLRVALVNAREVRNVPGRPKTDKLDAVWLAKLTERGMLRPSFVPPAQIRVLRDYTRMRTDLTQERTRYWQRLEKLLEDALIKVSSVAARLDSVSARAMVEALIRGERDPQVLAGLARGAMRTKRAALVQALTGRFDAHHGELARILLDQIDALNAQIDALTTRIEALITAADPTAADPTGTGQDGPDDGGGGGTPARTGLPALDRLVEIPGIARRGAQMIIAEVGLDMTIFPTAGHLTSWTRLTPRTIQSGAKNRTGRTGKGNPYLKGILGEAAAAAAKTNTFLGERYRRLVKRCGKRKALVAVARSITVIIWHLLADPNARFHDLGPTHHATKVNTGRKTRNLIRQLEALGHTVTLQPAA
jgi:transposase